MPKDFGEALTKYWPVITGVVVAAWALIRAALSNRALLEQRKGEIITIAQEAATGMIKILQGQVDAQRRQIEGLEDEVQELHRSMNVKDAEIALLRGQGRQWQALALSYEAKLTEASIPHEKPRQPFWGLDAGDAPTELTHGKLP